MHELRDEEYALIVEKEIQRIKDIVLLYSKLQKMIPDYKCSYLDAFVDISTNISPHFHKRSIQELFGTHHP